MRIELNVDDREVSQLFRQIKNRVSDMTPLMNIIGETIRSSVVYNFEVGGRPEKWPESNRAILQDGQTLVDTGRLRTSINYQAGRDRVEVGTNVVYAAIHQFGQGRIPKREFLLVQNEDLEEIREATIEYLIG